MMARAVTATKLQQDWSVRCQNKARKATIIIKLQRHAGTCQDGYKAAAKLVGTVPTGSRKFTRNYKLQRNSRTGRGGNKTVIKAAARMVGTVPK